MKTTYKRNENGTASFSLSGDDCFLALITKLEFTTRVNVLSGLCLSESNHGALIATTQQGKDWSTLWGLRSDAEVTMVNRRPEGDLKCLHPLSKIFANIKFARCGKNML